MDAQLPAPSELAACRVLGVNKIVIIIVHIEQSLVFCYFLLVSLVLYTRLSLKSTFLLRSLLLLLYISIFRFIRFHVQMMMNWELSFGMHLGEISSTPVSILSLYIAVATLCRQNFFQLEDTLHII